MLRCGWRVVRGRGRADWGATLGTGETARPLTERQRLAQGVSVLGAVGQRLPAEEGEIGIDDDEQRRWMKGVRRRPFSGLCAEPDLPDILRLVLGNVRLRSGRWPVFLEGSKGGLLFCQRNGKSRLMLPGEHLTRVIIFLLVLLLARPSCGPARWHQWCCSF